jgi:AspT/YidE/YbjL antiporter-like protein
MLWTMPLPANIVLRNFGLAMFLATVGVNAGQPLFEPSRNPDLRCSLSVVAVLLTTVAIVLLVGHYVLKIPYDDLVGVASGATGNPAILVYSTKMAPTERPDIGYAMIFPSMTLVKVIAAQIVGLLMVGGSGRLGDRAQETRLWLNQASPPQPPIFSLNAYSPRRDQGGCREGRRQEDQPSLSGFVDAGGDRRGRH